MMFTITCVGLLMCGAIVGAMVRDIQGGNSTRTYQSPELHRGVWGNPTCLGTGDQTRVRWERIDRVICRGSVASKHEAVRCHVGPGVAHLDECACGATRSGVFGEWFLPRT